MSDFGPAGLDGRVQPLHGFARTSGRSQAMVKSGRAAEGGRGKSVRPALARVAALDMTAERRRSACLDRGHDLALVVGQPVALGSAKSAAVAAENIRHLQLLRAHDPGSRKALSLCFGLSISWSGKRNFAG